MQTSTRGNLRAWVVGLRTSMRNVREKINMRNVEFNIHCRDIERWAWEEITIRIGYTHFEEIELTWCSGEVGEFLFSTLYPVVWVICKSNERGHGWAYRLVDVGEELAGRELDVIFESRRFRDDWTAVGQLYEVCQWLLVTRINLDDTLSITNLILFLAQVTHFKEGSTEFTDHQIVVDWKWFYLFRWSSVWKEWWLTCEGLPGACCAWIASELPKMLKLMKYKELNKFK